MKPGAKSESPFENDPNRYAAYLDTPEGRLRADLSLAHLQELLPPSMRVDALRALDLGCGTGCAAVLLARRGIHVTLLDSSQAMLELAERTTVDAGVSGKITIKHDDAVDLTRIFPAGSFDIVLCHNLLEFVDDPTAVLRGAAGVMRDSSAILSVLVRSQAGEVLKAALQRGDLAAAEQNLNAEWGEESLYGGKVRLFSPETLEATLRGAGLTIAAFRGVRVIADYLPVQISRSAEYDRIFALECDLGKRSEFFGVARYMQCLGRTMAGPKGGE